MRIIGKDGKEYKTEKECLAADRAYDAKIEADALAKEAEKAALEKRLEEEQKMISAKKKELAATIEATQLALDEAQKLYDITKSKAQEKLRAADEEACKIIDEAKALAHKQYKQVESEVDDMMLAASKQLEKASEDRMNAIAAFNKEFGPYRTVITGNKALDEYNKVKKTMDEFFNRTWNSFFRNF
jgi:hypothetical protein